MFSKNFFLRANENNPLLRAFEQLIESVKKQISQFSLAQLLTDSENGLHYVIEGQTGVNFWLAATSLENEFMSTPNLSIKQNEDLMHCEFVETEDILLSGITINPQFYVRLGSNLANILPSKSEN